MIRGGSVARSVLIGPRARFLRPPAGERPMAAKGPAAAAFLGAPQGYCVTAWCVAAFTLIASPAVTRGAERPSSSATVAASRAEEPLREYRALRRMHAWNDKFNHEAWMDVWTELKGGQFTFEIV